MSFLILGLLTVFGLGVPFCLLLPRNLSDRWSAAPVFGLALLGVVLTIAYIHNFQIGSAFYILACAALILLATAFWFGDRIWLVSLVSFGIIVGAICLAPLWVGGSQFAIFQANPSDQFNYLSLAAAVSSDSYEHLVVSGPHSSQTFLRAAAHLLKARPTVSIILAALRPSFYLTSAEAAYPFQAFLQALSAFGVLFVARNIFGAGKVIGLLASAAFALGFFPQYISDINAWSSLLALNLGLIVAALVSIAMCSAGGPGIIAPLSLAAAALLYFYPESSAACILPCIAIFIWSFRVSRTAAVRSAYVAAAAVIAIAVCLPAWEPTVRFLFAQATVSTSLPADWFRFFDAFYFGENSLPHEIATVYDILSAPIDVIVGMIGAYFLAPSPDLPLWLRCVWKIAEYLFVGSLVTAIILAAKDRMAFTFLIGCLASLFLPLILAFRGEYWSAGKAVSMVSPFIFVALVSPVLTRGWLAAPAAVLVSLQLGFGIERISAAADRSGVRANGPYPHDQRLKEQYDWNLTKWRNELKGCQRVAVDIEDAHLERFVETFLSDLRMHWIVRTDRRTNYYAGSVIPAESDSGKFDCDLADNLARPPIGRLIYLANDHHAADFYTGAVEQIDLINESATGVYNLDSYRDGKLKWTSGQAFWSLPYNPGTRALIISLWQEAIPPGATIRVLVDGYEIANGPVWEGPKEFPISVKGPLTISIESPTFHSPGDSRELGLPLKSVVVARMMAEEQIQTVTELPDGSVFAAGKWVKTTSDTVEIPFGVTFASPPFVVVTPNFSRYVEGVETVGQIDRDKFQVNGANFTPGFSINWIAVGKK